MPYVQMVNRTNHCVVTYFSIDNKIEWQTRSPYYYVKSIKYLFLFFFDKLCMQSNCISNGNVRFTSVRFQI